MGLVIGILVQIVTLAWCGMIIFANGMSDAPSAHQVGVLPWFFGGTAMAGLLIASHYLRWSW